VLSFSIPIPLYKGGGDPLGSIMCQVFSTFVVERKSNSCRKRKGEKNSVMFSNFDNTKQAAEYARENFLWSLRESSTLQPNLLPENHHDLCPDFDLLMVMRHAHSSHIPEMVQAIFFAIVLNDAAELGLSSRVTMNYMMSALRELKLTLSNPGCGELRIGLRGHRFSVLWA